MDKILELKASFLEAYEKNEKLASRIIKFVICLVAMLIITFTIGHQSILGNPIVAVLISVACAFLPKNVDVLILLLVVVGHLFSITSELGLVSLVMLLIMYFIYFRFTPKFAFVVILTPILFFIKIPYVIPLVLGFTATPIAIIPAIFGVAFFYLMNYAAANMALLASAEADVNQVVGGVQAVFGNKECLITMAVFAAVILIVYYVKRTTINNAPTLSILIAGVVNIVVLLVGNIIIGNADLISLVFMIAGTVISVLLAIVIQVAILPLDYSKTVTTQFEDDDYYYYVKAVPKHSIAKESVNIKHINRRK